MTRLNAPSARTAYLRKKETAIYLSCSVALLEKWYRLGTGPRRTLLNGTLPVYSIAELDRWAQQQVAPQ